MASLRFIKKPTYRLQRAELWHLSADNVRFVVALPCHVSSRVIAQHATDALGTCFETQGSVYVVADVHERTVASYAEVERAKLRVVTECDGASRV